MFSWLSFKKKLHNSITPSATTIIATITNKPPIEITIFTYYRNRPAVLLAARNAELRKI